MKTDEFIYRLSKGEEMSMKDVSEMADKCSRFEGALSSIGHFIDNEFMNDKQNQRIILVKNLIDKVLERKEV